jgi:hypothetical protein
MNTQTILNHLRDEGYLIIAWTPEELKNLDSADFEHIEDVLIMRGNDLIEQLQNEVTK